METVVVISKNELRSLVKRIGNLSLGAGVHEALTTYINEHRAELDPSRNVQWADLDIKLNKRWFDTHYGDDVSQRTKQFYYIRDLICSCVVHAVRIVQGGGKRKTLLQRDMESVLAFLDDTY
jgi:hypothetical protein